MFVSGSVRKRKTLTKGYMWQVTIELPRDPVTGERRRRYKTVNGTRKDAEQAKLQMISDIERGYYVQDNNTSVTEWVKTWMDVYIEPNVSPTTLSRYQGMTKRYIDTLIGAVPVQKLTNMAVQSWINSLSVSPKSGKPLSAATVKHAFHVLRGALDKAVEVELISRTPCKGIKLPKGEKKSAVIYDEEQIRQLIQAAKGTPMELVIDMELCMGLRRGELLGLQWQDVDWVNHRISIVRNRVLAGGQMIVKQPKTEAGIRTLDVPEQLIQKLRQHRADCMRMRKVVDINALQTDFIIVHPDGKLIYPEYLSQMFTKLQKKADLPKCRFHDLRHLCATIMCRQGITAKVAQERLGHKDITTTMNIYSHVMPSSAKEAADKIGELVYGCVAV